MCYLWSICVDISRSDSDYRNQIGLMPCYWDSNSDWIRGQWPDSDADSGKMVGIGLADPVGSDAQHYSLVQAADILPLTNPSVADPVGGGGGGGGGGSGPPLLGHDVGFLTLGPKLDPPFFACRPKMDPPPFKNPGSAPAHYGIKSSPPLPISARSSPPLPKYPPGHAHHQPLIALDRPRKSRQWSLTVTVYNSSSASNTYLQITVT